MLSSQTVMSAMAIPSEFLARRIAEAAGRESH